MTKIVEVLVVGQTPPPYHGQAIMIQMLLDGPIEGVRLHHVRMAFSENVDAVGRFEIGKVFHLLGLIVRVIWARLRFQTHILYYPPAGPNRIPVIRDTILLLCTRWMFTKTIFHFQASGIGEFIPQLPNWLQFLVRRAMLAPDIAIQLSSLIANDAIFLQATKTYTIPNAADDHAKQHVRTEMPGPLTATGKRCLYVGTVCESKGILVLLDALSDIRKNVSDIHLDVVGSFQPTLFEEIVKDRIAELGLSSNVTLHGQKIGVSKWNIFANSDIFCFPSHYESEGFPCVLVEAMSFGIPIVSTQWRGIPSIVDHGKTGYLVEPKDAKKFGEMIQTLLNDPTMCSEFGSMARRKYESDFTRKKHLERMGQVFRDVED